jgi:hypothetical protein
MAEATHVDASNSTVGMDSSIDGWYVLHNC